MIYLLHAILSPKRKSGNWIVIILSIYPDVHCVICFLKIYQQN